MAVADNTRERLHRISSCCDETYEALQDIKSKVLQIIAYKKNSPQSAGDALIRRQVSSYINALENLSNINKDLEKAVKDVHQLCQEAHRLLLGEGAEKQAGIGLGMGGGSADRQEDEDDGSNG